MYNSHEFNVTWVAVGSAILNDQGLQESGETEGVKGVCSPSLALNKILMFVNRFERSNTVARTVMRRYTSKPTHSMSFTSNVFMITHSYILIHSQLLSMKLLEAEWGDNDAFMNAAEIGPNSTAKTDPNSKFTQGSPMKVERARDAVPTLFGMNAEDFNKLTNINKLRKCWTYSTGKLYCYLPTTLCANIYCVSHGGPNVKRGPSASLEGTASKICFQRHSGPFIPMQLSCTWAKFSCHCKRHC